MEGCDGCQSHNSLFDTVAVSETARILVDDYEVQFKAMNIQGLNE